MSSQQCSLQSPPVMQWGSWLRVQERRCETIWVEVVAAIEKAWNQQLLELLTHPTRPHSLFQLFSHFELLHLQRPSCCLPVQIHLV